MKKTNQNKAEWDILWTRHREYRAGIRSRLSEFRRVLPDQYFYELAYCLLTPQSNALHAFQVQKQLEKLQFHAAEFDPEPLLRQKESYIRFHRTKSRMLLLMKAQFPAIKAVLRSNLTAYEIRDWLVHHVKECGLKESTHFLRNIGRNDGLSILDRHIMRNLLRWKIIRSIPPSLTRKQYLALEEKFQHFAGEIGIPIDELDLLFWSQETGQILK